MAWEGGLFMDLEQAARALQSGKNGAALKKLTESEAGAALAGKVDGAAIEQAARSGDTKALSELLKTVLSTPEGAAFAAQVTKAVRGDGQ